MSWIVFLVAIALGAAGECESPSARDRSPCSDRAGHCFDLTLGGHDVVLTEPKESIAALEDVASQEVCWSLPEPLSGRLSPVVSANSFTEKGLEGLYDEIEIFVTPLEGQMIPTRKEVRTDPTVRIGGAPMQTMVDVIDVDALPSGAYIATFRVRGPGGWDRKAVHLTVAPSTSQ